MGCAVLHALAVGVAADNTPSTGVVFVAATLKLRRRYVCLLASASSTCGASRTMVSKCMKHGVGIMLKHKC